MCTLIEHSNYYGVAILRNPPSTTPLILILLKLYNNNKKLPTYIHFMHQSNQSPSGAIGAGKEMHPHDQLYRTDSMPAIRWHLRFLRQQ